MKLKMFVSVVTSILILCSCDIRNETKFDMLSDSKGNIYRIDKKTGEIGYVTNKSFSIIDGTKSGATVKLPTIEQPDSYWHWMYRDSAAEEDNYPILIIRDGFKVLRNTPEGDFVVGWKLYALNTSPTTNYTLQVRMDFIDVDYFTIKVDTSSELLKSEILDMVKGTVILTKDDIFRLRGANWNINIDQNWKNEKLKGDRYERAASILKKNNCPLWFSNFLKFLFFDECNDGNVVVKRLFPRYVKISENLDIKADCRLIEICNKLNVSLYNLKVAEINTNPNWSKLSPDEVGVINVYKNIKNPFVSDESDIPVYGVVWDEK